MTDAIQDFAERYTAAWCSHDPQKVAAHFATDGWLSVNTGEPAVGRPAIAAVAQGFMTVFPDLVLHLQALVPTANAIEYHWRLVGTANGPGDSGRIVDICGVEAWTLAPDGLIAQSRGRFDADDYARQLGGA